ncbi:MAG: GGDEF domain-containing protein [Thermoleophilia bacterium]|nr:GGDEF domain-containing protein [Thermoleophilia bacterium]
MKGDSGLYQTILDSITDGVYVCDRQRRITYWNAGAERITGYSAQQVTGTSCSDGILMHVDDQGTELCRHGCPVSATLADGQAREVRVYVHHREGHRVPVLVRTHPVRSTTGEVESVIETFTDNSALIDALRRVEELSVQTETDHLTEVGNRRSMEARLDACVAEKRRVRARTGVLFVDIDHFKRINDTYGHEVGDRVLRMVAQTLKHNLRTTDCLARWGGEEFLALLTEVGEKSLRATAEKLRMLVANSYLEVGDDMLRVTISLGATLVQPSDTRESLVARADALLYQSKTEGRDRVTLGL